MPLPPVAGGEIHEANLSSDAHVRVLGTRPALRITYEAAGAACASASSKATQASMAHLTRAG